MDQHFDQQYSNAGGAKSHVALIVIISVVVTAALIGGSVFMWQQTEANKLNEKITQTEQLIVTQKTEIESKNDEIVQLTSKVTELETELTAANNPFSDWQTHTETEKGYSIMFPSHFSYQEGAIVNYDNSEQGFGLSGINRLNIQVQKHSLPEEFSSFEAYAANAKATSTEFTEPAVSYTLGDHVVLSQYTTNGPGGAFMTYIAHKPGTDAMYYLLVFETGFTNNKELAEQIVSTFRIL